MKGVNVPGAMWVIALAIVNALPMALQDAFPGAVWVPLAIDLLLVAAKAIQVYMPKDVEPAGAQPANFVAPANAALQPDNRLRKFFVG